MSINSFWISTTARTGSMWLYNVTREILKLSNINVLPTLIPKSDEDFFKIFKNQSLKDKNKKNFYVLKIHKILKSDLPRSKIITTIRDPRDIFISFKEFMKTDFNTTLKATKSLLNFEKTYKTYNKDYVEFFKYEDSEKNAIKTISRISKFIGFEINDQCAEDIFLKYDKNKVKKLIKINDESLFSKIKNKKKINNYEIVSLSNDNFRSFDSKTGFQTNHISNRNSGDWKNFLSTKEMEILNLEFKDFIKRYKY